MFLRVTAETITDGNIKFWIFEDHLLLVSTLRVALALLLGLVATDPV